MIKDCWFQFEKPCLVVETERQENPDVKRAFAGGFVEQHGGLHRTKYVDMILAQLSQVGSPLFYQLVFELR